MTATDSTDFAAAFDAASKRVNGDQPAWWHAARRESFALFQDLGLPTRRDEEWKYTNVRPIAETPFGLPDQTPVSDISAAAPYRSDADLELVFVNGVFSAEHSRPRDGADSVWAGPLSRSTAQYANAVKGSVAVDASADAFTALNGAFMEDGGFVDVAADTVVPLTIHLLFVVTDEGQGVMMSPRTIIRAGAASEVRIMESHVSASSGHYFVNHVTDIDVGENAHVHHALIQAQGAGAIHIGRTRIRQAAYSDVATFAFETGARLARQNLDIELNGQGTHTSLDGFYAAQGGQHIDNHTSIDHRFPNCDSDQLYKGILNGDSRAVFNGKIFVRRDAQQTNAYQLNRNLMLSPGSKVDTKPQLEIFADDVKCTHGAAVGQLDEEEIFYFQTRGIAREDAIKLLSLGYARDVIGRVKDESIRARLELLLGLTFVPGQV